MTNQPSEGQWHNGQLGASVCKGEPSKVPNLAELIDVPALQSLLDDFYRLARIPVTIVDLDGTLLVAAGWQEICGKFHRAHAESRQLCLQSDTELTGGIPSGECRLYKCKNNLWDMATPITVDGHHVGNVVSGQFFFEGERVDERVFEAQAKRFGFNRSEYLAAFAAVPRLSREVVNTGISFLVKLAETISRVGYSNFRLKHSLAERDSLTRSLQQNELLLNQQAVDLEKLVQERTAKLQETVEELEHYSYTLTHDLRAPLRAMQGFASMLLDESQLLSGERLELLRRIARSAERMDQLIRDALDYSRVLRSDHPLTLVDLDELVRDLVNSYPNFRQPTAQIQIQSPLPCVTGNAAALTQCFSNLLGNAVKFVAPGVVPQVVVRAEEKSDGLARIWVEDNGIGIAKAAHSRIFAMFERLHTAYEGTGIGLALVRKVVKRMNGDVGVESELGKGSRFWVEFQRAR